MNKKILLLGARGLVGDAIHQHFIKSSIPFLALNVDDMDVTQPRRVNEVIAHYLPTHIINCTGFINPDQCEQHPLKSYAVNVQGVRNLTQAILTIDPAIVFFHFSTDFVFKGDEGGYDERALAMPINQYGVHKYVADEIIASTLSRYYILRVASVMGCSPLKKDFSRAIIDAYKKRNGHVSVVNDMRISMVTTPFIAEVVLALLNTPPACGVYHCVASGVTSWFDIATQIYLSQKLAVNHVIPGSFKDYQYYAPRPVNTSLVNEKLASVLQKPIPEWREMLNELLISEKIYYTNLVNEG